MRSEGGVPPDVLNGLAEVEDIGVPAPDSIEFLSGGCIHPAARVPDEDGHSCFLKWSTEPGPGGFGVEARGLDALRRVGGLYVPRVLGFDQGSEERRGWIALEFVEPGPSTKATAVELGRGLAELHRPRPEATPGWHEDGYIGPLEQTNRRVDEGWCAFWRNQRLEPLWQSVEERFSPSIRDAWDRVMDVLPVALEGAVPQGLSLLHGDLWSGNVLANRAGDPVLIDPAVYVGDREVDLAMMDLFGGFSPATFERYEEELPVAPGFRELRSDVYQLYPLLVHVRLFGQSYAAGVTSRLDRILSTL